MQAESSTWLQPPKSLLLRTGEVDVWRVELEQPSDREGNFLDSLDLDERRRAYRFHFAKDRSRFIVARGFLRHIISRYLETEAKQLRFCYGPYGKPALAGEHRNSRLCFNVSHSGGVGLYALARGREVGVDVENIRTDFTSERIARHFFSPLEVETLCRLPEEERLSAFFRCWTRKEAYIKATGRGLSQPLDAFDVTLAPGEPPALLRTNDVSKDAGHWSLFDLPVGENYSAAVAVERPTSNLRCWQGLL